MTHMARSHAMMALAAVLAVIAGALLGATPSAAANSVGFDTPAGATTVPVPGSIGRSASELVVNQSEWNFDGAPGIVAGQASGWFAFTAPPSGSVMLKASDTDNPFKFNDGIALWPGDLTADVLATSGKKPLAYSRNGIFSLDGARIVRHNLVPGQRYLVQVWGIPDRSLHLMTLETRPLQISIPKNTDRNEVGGTVRVDYPKAAKSEVDVLTISGRDSVICAEDCDPRQPLGSDGVLTARPNPGYVFAGWTGGCSGTGACTPGNSPVTANFERVGLSVLTIIRTGRTDYDMQATQGTNTSKCGKGAPSCSLELTNGSIFLQSTYFLRPDLSLALDGPCKAGTGWGTVGYMNCKVDLDGDRTITIDGRSALAPDAPAKPTVALANGSAVIRWATPAANGAPITRYQVIDGATGRNCATSAELTCSIDKIDPASRHSFTVSASNRVGTSYSAATETPAVASPAPTPTPTLTPAPTPTPTETPTSGVPTPTPSNSSTTPGPVSTTAPTSSPTPSNSANPGTDSPTTQDRPQAPGAAPSAPRRVKIKAKNRTLIVKWESSATSGAAPTEYEVRLRAKAAPLKRTIIVRSGNIARITELVNGKKYTVTIRAINQSGKSPWVKKTMKLRSRR
jgi:hypothetical protein